MAFSTDDLDRLDRAIKLGATRVTYGDGVSVSFRSLDEMFALRERMRAELGVGGPRPNRRVFAPSKGVQSGGLSASEWRRC